MPIIPPICVLSIEMNKTNPSATNGNPLSGNMLPPLPCHAYRNIPTENQSFHAVNLTTSKYSSSSSLCSNFPSVKSSGAGYSYAAPTIMSPFNTPCALDPSTSSRASSLKSSHQTTGTSSALHLTSSTPLSLLPTSMNQNHMTSPHSNLTSSDLMGIMNGKLPELLHLPTDFLPTKKKLIDEKNW